MVIDMEDPLNCRCRTVHDLRSRQLANRPYAKVSPSVTVTAHLACGHHIRGLCWLQKHKEPLAVVTFELFLWVQEVDFGHGDVWTLEALHTQDEKKLLVKYLEETIKWILHSWAIGEHTTPPRTYRTWSNKKAQSSTEKLYSTETNSEITCVKPIV